MTNLRYSPAANTLFQNQETNVTEIAPGLRQTFALAGNAVVTLQGQNSRFTYRIVRRTGAGQTTHWVSVLNGPNNETDFLFLGGLDPKQGFYVSRKSPISMDAPSAKAFVWFWAHRESSQVQVFHSGRCGRCGRLLTTPESVRTGLGPTCAARTVRKAA